MRATGSLAALVLSSALVLAVPAAALASGGGGGGGGGGNPPPGSPAVTLSPGSLTFPAELTGVTSPPQTVTVSNTAARRCSLTACRSGERRWITTYPAINVLA
jgi:hypothetical protein